MMKMSLVWKPVLGAAATFAAATAVVFALSTPTAAYAELQVGNFAEPTICECPVQDGGCGCRITF